MGEDRLIIIPIGIAIVHKKQDLIVRAVVSTRKIIFCYGREMRAGYCVFSHRIYVSRERATEEDAKKRDGMCNQFWSLCASARGEERVEKRAKGKRKVKSRTNRIAKGTCKNRSIVHGTRRVQEGWRIEEERYTVVTRKNEITFLIGALVTVLSV